MNGWIEGIGDALRYIEENLTEELKVEDIAAKAYVSAFHFQRIFSVLCGYTLGEYIRLRRLTRAAEELAATDQKVIDIAVKYGYDSPDSFAKAFTRFHGLSPSAAKEPGAKLRAFAPLQIKLTLKGGRTMEYRIEEKAAFTLIGKLRKFSAETSHKEIPLFWEEHMAASDEIVCGMFGLCIDSDGETFDYLIADLYHPMDEIPAGYETRTIPAGTWAVFPCRGALPEALQTVNDAMWSEWLPNCREYKLAGNYNIEMYTPLHDDPKDDYNEIWLPVERV